MPLEKAPFTQELLSRDVVVSRFSVLLANAMEKGVLEMLPGAPVCCSAVAMFYPRGSCFSAVGAGLCVFLGRRQGTGLEGATRVNTGSLLPCCHCRCPFLLWVDGSLVIFCLLLTVVFL